MSTNSIQQTSNFLSSSFMSLSNSQVGYLCVEKNNLVEIGALWKIIEEFKGLIGFTNNTSIKAIGDYLVSVIKSAKKQNHIFDVKEVAIIIAIASRGKAWGKINDISNHTKLTRNINKLVLENTPRDEPIAQSKISLPSQTLPLQIPLNDNEGPADINDENQNSSSDVKIIEANFTPLVPMEIIESISSIKDELILDKVSIEDISSVQTIQKIKDQNLLEEPIQQTAWSIRKIALTTFALMVTGFVGAYLSSSLKPISDNTKITLDDGNIYQDLTKSINVTLNSSTCSLDEWKLHRIQQPVKDTLGLTLLNSSSLISQNHLLSLNEPQTVIPTSTFSLPSYIQFIQNLDPNKPQDAVKILLGKNKGFDFELYNKDRKKCLQKLFNPMANILHPDKCRDVNCKDVYDKLSNARKCLMETKIPLISEDIIDEKIIGLDVNKAETSLIATLFPFEKQGFDVMPVCGHEEMRRRVSLLPKEQAAAILDRFGYHQGVFYEDKIFIGGILDYLTNEQLVYILPMINFMRLADFEIVNIFPHYPPEKKVILNRHLAALSKEQLYDLIFLRKLITLDLLDLQQRKELIQSLDFSNLTEKFFQLLRENEHLFTSKQVAYYIELRALIYSDTINRLSEPQLKEYIQNVDMKTINPNLLLMIFHNRGCLVDILSDEQKKQVIEANGEWFLETLRHC